MIHTPHIEKNFPNGLVDGHAYCYPRALGKAQPMSYDIKHDLLFQNYIKTLRKNKLSGALLTQPSVLGLNHHYLLDCLDYAHKKHPDMFFRGIVNLPSNVHISTMKQMQLHGVLGVRVNWLNRFPPDFKSAAWRDFMEHLHVMGWFLEVQIESNRLIDILEALIDSAPYLVIEHFCLPSPQMNNRDDIFFALEKLSYTRKQKLSILLSGAYRVFEQLELSAEQSALHAIPLAHAISDAMGGEEYCIWGSDWPFGQLTHEQDYVQALDWGKSWLKDDGRKGIHHLLNKLYYSR
ncbi:MAG: amidohydrolase family protein [Alphaproteobacteria bacterium]|nr:amidohydrolase family protein [Alphaproteobacteria bacterium]